MAEDELSPEYLEKMAETEKGARKLIEAVIDILTDVAREPSDKKIEQLGTFVTTYSKAIRKAIETAIRPEFKDYIDDLEKLIMPFVKR